MELFVYEEAKGKKRSDRKEKHAEDGSSWRFVARECEKRLDAGRRPMAPSLLGYKTHPRLSKELCPGKGVTSAAEIAPPHISARTRFERWWRKERRGAKDEQSLLFNRMCKYISLSFFFISNNSWNYTNFDTFRSCKCVFLPDSQNSCLLSWNRRKKMTTKPVP